MELPLPTSLPHVAAQVEDMKDVTLEIVLSESFDRLIRSRLEKQWHKVGGHRISPRNTTLTALATHPRSPRRARARRARLYDACAWYLKHSQPRCWNLSIPYGQVSLKAKQLGSDLGTLRKLLTNLLQASWLPWLTHLHWLIHVNYIWLLTYSHPSPF